MIRWALGFLLGVMGVTQCSHLPPLQIAYCGVGIGVGLMFFHRKPSFWFSFLIACCLGFSWALVVGHQMMYHELPQSLEGKTLIATGTITSIPEYHADRLRFDFQIQTIASHVSIHYPLHVRLTSYVHKGGPARLELKTSKKGEVWELAIRLKRPRSFWNPGSFDYQAQLFQQGICATGYIVTRIPPRLVQKISRYSHCSIDGLREQLTHNIRLSLRNHPLLGLITALVTGIRCDITSEQWQVMRGTGTNHLFAISGLHLAFIANMLYFLTRFLYCRVPYAVLIIPSSQIAAGLTGTFAILYAALAGFALPVQRALLMLLVFLWAHLCRRHLISGRAFLYALLVILICFPFSVLSASFWLSFTAVAFILYGTLGRLKADTGWQTWWKTQYRVGMGLIPFSLLFFHQISCLGFAANLLAIPAVGFLILPMALLGSLMTVCIPAFGNTLLILAAKALGLLWGGLSYLSKLEWAQYTAHITTPWVLLASLLGLLLLLAPQGIPARYLAAIYLLPLFFWKPVGPKKSEVWFHLLDVGQGLASVVRTKHHTLVYDTGPNRSLDAGNAVLVPFLKHQGIRKIDMLIISHGDNDHIGGADSLLRQVPVTAIMSSVPRAFLPYQAALCQENTHWRWDEVDFEVLYPAPHHAYSGNNSSCVLKINHREHSILLTGDIEEAAENHLVAQAGTKLASTILVAPHHGSKTSSSIAFLNCVQPNIVLLPTGYRNQFKFPHPGVLGRYRRLHAQLYDTAVEGAITLKLDANLGTVMLETYRQRYRHFWQ